MPFDELFEDSPSINASAEVDGVPTEQRGVTRPQGTTPDIGVFERGGNSQTITFADVAQFTVIIDSLLEVVVSEAPIFNPETGLFESIVTVTNPHQVPVSGFILRVDNLPSDVSVSNAQGMNNGLPAMAFTQTLQSGESVLVLVEFFRASGDPDFNPVYEAEFILPAETNLPFAITRITRLPNGEIELEWPTLPGQIYAIEYSLNLVNWTRVQPHITAVNERFQWTDPGTPQTTAHPSTVDSRFYRVLRLTP